MNVINVTIWNEFRHEVEDEQVKSVYPNGIHEELKAQLSKYDDVLITTATLDQPQHGLSDEVLNNTDVLVWWGHIAHHEVSDEIVNKVHACVLAGMGLIVLHSAHASKIFCKLCGTDASQLKWREDGEIERVWLVDQAHPIAKGISEYIELPKEEMYGEAFGIPAPDETVFISWFEGGEVFRSGITYKRGLGKVFYFRPGHERFPTYKNEDIIKVIHNAIVWGVNKNLPNVIIGNTKPVHKAI